MKSFIYRGEQTVNKQNSFNTENGPVLLVVRGARLQLEILKKRKTSNEITQNFWAEQRGCVCKGM